MKTHPHRALAPLQRLQEATPHLPDHTFGRTDSARNCYSAVPSPHSSGHSNFHNPQTHKKQNRRFILLFNSETSVCFYAYARQGKQVTGGRKKQARKPFRWLSPTLIVLHCKTPAPSLAPSPPHPPPRSHGSCTKQELRSCCRSGFARRCKNVLHLQTTRPGTESPED